MENFDMSFSNPECNHHEMCGCKLSIYSRCPQFKHREFFSGAFTLSDQYRDVIGQMFTHMSLRDDPSPAEVEMGYLMSSISNSTNMKAIDAPYHRQAEWPQGTSTTNLATEVHSMVKIADRTYFALRFRWLGFDETFFEQELWNYKAKDEVPSLKVLAARQFSAYHAAFGLTNGRPHVRSAAQGLYENFKLVKTLLIMQRPLIGDRPLPAFVHLKDAVRHFWRMSGIDYRRKDKYPLSMRFLYPMYLGTSNGNADGATSTIETEKYVIRASPKGKKLDTFYQEVTRIIHMIRDGKDLPVYFDNSVKAENNIDFTVQWDDEKWRKFEEKCRIFVIPTSLYVLLERMVSVPRHYRERGKVIRVGQKWGHGGADTIAKLLNVLDTPMSPCLVAGDVKKFDQAVLAEFVDAYWSTHLAYHDELDPDFPVIKALVKYLCYTQLTRITRLISDQWAVMKGGVPSGLWNTSHQDSWVMAMYFIMFGLHQIRANIEVSEELELYFIDIVRIIVYGDDHLYNRGTHVRWSHFFSGKSFASYCMRMFNVEIRDLEDGITFLSDVKMGYIVRRGATFLRHQFVNNPYYGLPAYPGQCRYLPFRETREIMARVVWSREVKPREPLDILLSCISHAYGTYASNRDAYERLLILYETLISEINLTEETLTEELKRRAETNEASKLRQLGLSLEEIVQGFPSWETLIRKNVYDPVYQDNTREYDATGSYQFQDPYH